MWIVGTNSSWSVYSYVKWKRNWINFVNWKLGQTLNEYEIGKVNKCKTQLNKLIIIIFEWAHKRMIPIFKITEPPIVLRLKFRFIQQKYKNAKRIKERSRKKRTKNISMHSSNYSVASSWLSSSLTANCCS